jgi:mono/diheme cytochrome c family protein
MKEGEAPPRPYVIFMKLTRNQLILNAVFCLILVAVIIWALYAEYDRPWKKYQKDKKIQQLWLSELDIVDRCSTCHQGIDKSGAGDKPQPFKTHSGNYLKHHKVEKFGCVVCHEGQGAALTVDAAHDDVKNWTKPVLKGSFAQSSCGKCHPMNHRLPLTVELKGAPVFIQGWKLFNEYNCIGCHKMPGYKRPDRIGPSLTAIGSKVNRDWLLKWLKDPKEYLKNTKMPGPKLSDKEIGHMADYLLSLAVVNENPPTSPFFKGGVYSPLSRGVRGVSPPLEKGGKGGFEKADSVEGKNLVKELGCLGCHMIDEKGNNFAPDLSGIGNKVNADWPYRFLKNPKTYDPKAMIPDILISEEEIQNITAYLMTLKKNKYDMKNPPRSPFFKGGIYSPLSRGVRGVSPSLVKRGEGRFIDNINKGKKLVKDKGCTGCHEIEKLPKGYDAPPLDGTGNKRIDELYWGNIKDIKKTLADWLLIKVMHPEKFATDKIVTRMPNYRFNEQQAKSLVTFLLGMKKDAVPVKYMKTLVEPDSPEIRGKKVFEKYNCLGCHKLNKKGGDVSVDLTKEGKKSRPDWLFAFLKTPYKIRPDQMLKARMPDFKLSKEEINDVIEYLALLAEVPYPYNFEPKKEVHPEDIDDGEKLYYEIFACIGCHSINGRGGQVGPDHTDVASRLTKEWIEQWLKDPQAIQSDVRMPKFKFQKWEFEALTNYLLTLGKYRFVQVKKTD